MAASQPMTGWLALRGFSGSSFKSHQDVSPPVTSHPDLFLLECVNFATDRIYFSMKVNSLPFPDVSVNENFLILDEILQAEGGIL